MSFSPSQFDWFFFDLDGTLWDHATASREAVARVCEQFRFAQDDFAHHFHVSNMALWKDLSAGKIDFPTLRIRRFEMVMEAIGRTPPGSSAEEISSHYLDCYLSSPRAYGGHDLAIELAAKRGRVAILTNAPREIQEIKFSHLGDSGARIEFMLCADEAPAMKPDRRFYEAALAKAGHPDPSRVVMIGDSWTEDAEAAARMGWKALWISHGRPAPEDVPGIYSVMALEGVCGWLKT